MREFIKYTDVIHRLCNILNPIYNKIHKSNRIEIENAYEWIEDVALEIVMLFDIYLHKDTNILGRLIDIKLDWNKTNIKYGEFENVIQYIDEYYELEEEGCEKLQQHEKILNIFQNYAIDWFFNTFNTTKIKNDFKNFITINIKKDERRII